MSIETEISSLTTALRNLTDVLLASAAKSLPPTSAVTVAAVSTTVSEPATVEVPAPEPKKAVKKEPAPTANAESVTPPAPAPVPEATKPNVSEDDQRVQIVELARPNMADAAFKAFLGAKLAELQGAACSISGSGKLPKIDAAHLPALLAAINKQLGK
jgi:type IV secretory pathway VirB10-like protein